MRRSVLVFAVCLTCGLSGMAAERTDPTPAVDRALEFLQRTQESDGAWKGGQSKHAAVTALSVMAFLSAGHVPGEGKYGQTVEKGVRWVMQKQKPNGIIVFPESEGGHEMYHHGICTLMLAEAAGMTEGKLAGEVRQKLEKAVAVVLKGQRGSRGDHHGGWRYHLDERQDKNPPADISVTGWQLLALRAAKNLGCDVPPESIDEAVQYIKRCQDPSNGGFRYFPGSRVTVPCTGTSILGLEVCGKDRHRSPEALKAGAYLINNPPRWGQAHFFYAVYYCSQATFQLGGQYWESYRANLHKELLGNQNRSNGSWYGGDGDARFGPNYCTAMAVLALTVEYRFLPIYQRGEEPEQAGAQAKK